MLMNNLYSTSKKPGKFMPGFDYFNPDSGLEKQEINHLMITNLV